MGRIIQNYHIDLTKLGFGLYEDSAGPDPDAESYFTAAGITSDTQKSAITTFVRGLKSLGVWNSIVDLGLYMGGASATITNAKVKLKYPVGIPNMIDLSGVALTNSNYVAGEGIRVTSNNKKLSTGIIPISHGLSHNNITIMHGVTDAINSTSLYTMLDNDPSATTAYFRKDVIGVNPGVAYNPPIRTLTPYVYTITSNSGVIAIHDWNQHNSAVAMPTGAMDTEISVFGGKVGGADVFSSCSVGFHLISSYLTTSQISSITTLVNQLWTALGRKSVTKDVVCFGDSITLGVGSTGSVSRYSYLLAQELGLKENPAGVHGSRLRVDTGTILGGYGRRSILTKYNILSGGKVYIQYGVNDCNNDTGNGTNLDDFRDKLRTIAEELLAHGMSPSNVVIGSISWINTATTTRQQNYRDKALEAAQLAGCYYADVWQYMNDNGGATLMSDTVHPNNNGHLAIKTALLTAAAV
jgi:lysophospholipase L1-like esterase